LGFPFTLIGTLATYYSTMAREPEIAVILSCRAFDQQVERTLESLAAQTLRPSEVVLAGVSTEADSLPPRAQELSVRVVSAEAGVAEEWNAGATSAQSQYLCFLKPGDTLDPTYFEKCLFLMQAYGLDLCASWEQLEDGTHQTGPSSDEALLSGEPLAATGAILGRGAFLESGCFDKSVPPHRLVGELWTRLAKAGARGHVLTEALIHPAQDGTAATPGTPDRVRKLDGPAVLVCMPYLTVGGAEASVSLICSQLDRLGFSIFLVTTTPVPGTLGDTTSWFQPCTRGIYHLPRFLHTGLWLAFVCRLIERHSIGLIWQVGSGFIYEHLPRIKRLFPGLAAIDLLFNPVGHTEQFFKTRRSIDHVITEHEDMQKWLVARGVRKEDVSVIPNGIDLDLYKPQPRRDWRTGKLRTGDSRFVAGYIGRLSEEKAPDTFLEIAARFKGQPQYEFLLCGAGPMESKLRAICVRQGLEDRAHFAGLVPAREYLPCCDVLVLCSRMDGRPNVLMESLAMGVPVVASRVGGIPEMAPEGQGTRLCQADDVGQFQAAIEDLASDRQLHEQLAAAGRRWAETHFSIVQEYADLFRELIARCAPLARPLKSMDFLAATGWAGGPPADLASSASGQSLWKTVQCALSPSRCRGSFLTLLAYRSLRGKETFAGGLSPWFDPSYYAKRYPDVDGLKVSLFWHFLLRGRWEQRDPSALFNTRFYLAVYPDVAASGVNPLVQYLAYGRQEGRSPAPERRRSEERSPARLALRELQNIMPVQDGDLVSIVIPCYNPSGFLFEAIASVAAQTYTSIETILVNDGTDLPESRMILERAARQVGVYIEQENRGLAAARNAGFRAARGRFVVPLDADDIIEPGYVATCVAALTANPDAAYAYTSCQVFGTRNYIEDPGTFNLYKLLDSNFLFYISLIRKEEWEQAGGYDDSMRLGYEDWELWLRLGSRGRYGCHVSQVLFRYRKHGSSLYDLALAHHQQLVDYIQGRHPELYAPEARARLKAQWAPSACIVSPKPPADQSIADVQILESASFMTERSLSPAFVLSETGEVGTHSAEVAALAIWSGHASIQLPDGSVAVSRRVAVEIKDISEAQSLPQAPGRSDPQNSALWTNLHRHLVNAELLSWRSWTHHPVRSFLRLIPLRVKERINLSAGKPVFNLSFYMQFQPQSLVLGNALFEPLRYMPKPSDGRSRVALIVPHLGPGGAESVLLDMVSTLSRSRFEILLLATQSRDDRWRERWLQYVEHVYDLAQVVPPDRMAAAVYSIVLNWKCDLVLAQNSLYAYAALPQIKRDLPGTKTMDIIHSIDDRWDQVACSAEVAPCIDMRVAMSEAVRGRLLAAGMPAERVRLLRSGVDLERFCPAPVHADATIRQILFAGRLDPVKRPLLLVDIAAELRALRKGADFRFVIAGDGPEMSRFRRAVRRRKLEEFFDFRGQVADLASLYAASDVVVLVSRSEGVPLVVIEALACARPVVASNVGDIPELLDASCGILIDVAPGEARSFAVALDTLLGQPRLRETLGAEGRRKVEAARDLRLVRASYAALFDEVLESLSRNA
jgi:glycosyltransferase involved in cell wall biosynthesis